MATTMDLNLLKLYFVTWNVATKFPEQDLNQLLGLSHFNVNTPLPDIYIIGLQEVKSQPQNIVLDIFFEDPWTKSFREALKDLDYVKIRTQRLQGLVLNVFCLRKHMTNLRFIDTQYTKTGFGGIWGNKGAVSIRFNIYGVNVCLVNAHLTPHDHLLNDRISDYNTIVKDHSYDIPETNKIFFHDYVFWIGDLNFRLTEGLSALDIDVLVKKNQLETLLEKDQLAVTMKNSVAFSEFSEDKITFPPTYKFEFASQEYDLKRRPSWTDRILYKVNENVYENITLKAVQKSYKSHSSYVQSDHKPVTAEFKIVIRPGILNNGIEFKPIHKWFIDEENAVSYKLLGDTKSGHGDWIGLYHENFSGLDDYIVYEYVGRGKSETVTEADMELDVEQIFFSETSLRTSGMYRLVYIAQNGDVMGILGMSSPFPSLKRQT